MVKVSAPNMDLKRVKLMFVELLPAPPINDLPLFKGDTGGCCRHHRQIDVYRTVCHFIVRSRRGDYQSPVALPKIVPSIDTTVQTYNFAPLRGALLSCFAKKVTKEGDLGEALRLCCGNTSTFRYYPRQPKFALPQDPLPCFAKS